MKLYFRVSIFVLIFLAGPVSAVECLDYNEVELTGVLSKEIFPGPPNYESIKDGDIAEAFAFITLPSPVCVTQGDESGFQPEVSSIQHIQLIFLDRNAYKPLSSQLGKQVVCSGRFLGAHTGHHHSEVMLDNAKCMATDVLPESIALWKKQAPFFRSLDYSDEVKFKKSMQSYYAKVYGGEKHRIWSSWIESGNLDSGYYSSVYNNLEDVTVKNIISTGGNGFSINAEQRSCYSLDYDPPRMETIVKDYKVTNISQKDVNSWLEKVSSIPAEVCLSVKWVIKLTINNTKLIENEEWIAEGSTLELVPDD